VEEDEEDDEAGEEGEYGEEEGEGVPIVDAWMRGVK
jgi:hypothetical protein